MQMFEPTEVDTRTTSDTSPSYDDSDSDRDSLDENDNSSEEEEEEEENGDDWNDAADAAVEHIFNRDKNIFVNTGSTKHSLKTAKSSLASTLLPPSLSSPDIEKMERKRFMSHRAGVVSGAIPIGGTRTSKKKGRKSSEGENGLADSLFDSSGKLSKEEFQKLTREVHLLGKLSRNLKFYFVSVFSFSIFSLFLGGVEYHFFGRAGFFSTLYSSFLALGEFFSWTPLILNTLTINF
jgi:hypothetical protein